MAFDRVFSTGRKIVDKRIIVRLAPAERPRIGCTVSKKYGNSVRRHQFKRRVRAAFRQHYAELPAADMVFSALPDRGFVTYNEIDTIFTSLITDDSATR